MKLRLLCLTALLLSMMPVLSALPAATDTLPKLKGSSGEKVLLRYSYKAGDVFKISIDMSVIGEIKSSGRSIRVPIDMIMEACVDVLCTDSEGNARAEITFTRIAMSAKTPFNTFNYDSNINQSLPSPSLQPLAALLGPKIPCTITARGETRDIDTGELIKAMKAAGSEDTSSVINNINDSLQSNFIPFPENPVSVGQIFDAGHLVKEISEVGRMDMSLKYKVLSVSADKCYVVLKPIARIKAALSGDIPVTTEYINLDGWLLFDRNAGLLKRSFLNINLKLISKDKSKTKMVVIHENIKVRCKMTRDVGRVF